jgi:ABC-2 type transport system permease protein
MTIRHAPTPRREEQAGRYLSPNARRSSGLRGMLANQIHAEFMQNVRVLEFLVGIVVFPVMLYAMFGLPNAGQTLPEGTSVGAFLMASFGAYGVLGIAIFAFGVDIASERGRGWLRLMRATPMPAWVYFAGKAAMALLFSVITLGVLFGFAALAAGVRLEGVTWLQLALTLLLGGAAFSTLGFALGYWASPRGASPLANLIYLPLSFASGFFVPLGNLPQFLQDLAPYLPTYYLGQLVWRAVGTPADIALLAAAPSGEVWQHALWLVGSFAFFGVLALVGYRRDDRREFG